MEHSPELLEDTVGVNNPQPLQQQPSQSGPKHSHPAQAKTFQCRECHMAFSRSEHLARHIRKHTGERPFTCHCGKQFSRLDNLHQHAQTVHADKQDLNERMIRDATSLHTSMAAANKSSSSHGGRKPLASHGIADSNRAPSGDMITREDLSMSLHQRLGTSTGYESDDNLSSLLSPTFDAETPSPTENDASPFFFSPPSLRPPTVAESSLLASVNPRKRPFPGADGPYNDPASSHNTTYDYEYSSESGPQSRRLSVMELYNDANDNTESSTFLLSSARAESRPTTSGLVSSASTLALVNRPSQTLTSSIPSFLLPKTGENDTQVDSPDLQTHTKTGPSVTKGSLTTTQPPKYPATPANPGHEAFGQTLTKSKLIAPAVGDRVPFTLRSRYMTRYVATMSAEQQEALDIEMAQRRLRERNARKSAAALDVSQI